MSRYLTQQEVAEVIGVPLDQIDRWISDGRLQPLKMTPFAPDSPAALWIAAQGHQFSTLAVNDLIGSLTAEELRGIDRWETEGQPVS